ncbi:hypothetical protein NDU88_004527 [Pleurodeles waltl]|uniref:Uncharacterized protein n=1 Tax=Pleurodeles waltl TaxID=8319 RepID=A0AAV7WUL5_PLEWA|nr:hypothetical protein NDU88_004527 [Pleurodeles waltl]
MVRAPPPRPPRLPCDHSICWLGVPCRAAWCCGKSGAPVAETGDGAELRSLSQRLLSAGVECRCSSCVVGLGPSGLLAGRGGAAAALEGAAPLR